MVTQRGGYYSKRQLLKRQLLFNYLKRWLLFKEVATIQRGGYYSKRQPLFKEEANIRKDRLLFKEIATTITRGR